MSQQPQLNVDLSQATDVTCKNCGNYTFQDVHLIKHLSALVSPTGKPTFLPIPTFACNACGFVPDEFLPAALRKETEDKKTSLTPESAPTPSPVKLEIVKG